MEGREMMLNDGAPCHVKEQALGVTLLSVTRRLPQRRQIVFHGRKRAPRSAPVCGEGVGGSSSPDASFFLNSSYRTL